MPKKKEKYTTDKSFYELYYDFTGYQHDTYPKKRRAIAQDVAELFAHRDSNTGKLIVGNEKGLYIYDNAKGHKLLDSTLLRGADHGGFYEITSISHIGPALGYLAFMKQQNDERWKEHAAHIFDHIKQVRAFNSAPLEDNWVSKLDCPAWEGKEQKIKNMVDYSCSLAGNYLCKVQRNPDIFSIDHLEENFLDFSNSQFPIPFNTIMVGTFGLMASYAAYELYTTLGRVGINWGEAKVLLNTMPGTNYSAGAVPHTNWIYKTISEIGGAELNPDRLLIAPHNLLPKTIGEEALPEDDFNFLSNRVWGALCVRAEITSFLFPNIKDIPHRRPALIPGDYGYTKADQIDDFVQRLKYVMKNPSRMLSDTVGSWMAGEAAAKKWDFSNVDIPGFTHGLPKGVGGYPAISPKIE